MGFLLRLIFLGFNNLYLKNEVRKKLFLFNMEVKNVVGYFFLFWYNVMFLIM